jgi:hypothetical protein
VEENVIGFDVSVHDVASGEDLESLYYLTEIDKCSLL